MPDHDDGVFPLVRGVDQLHLEAVLVPLLLDRAGRNPGTQFHRVMLEDDCAVTLADEAGQHGDRNNGESEVESHASTTATRRLSGLPDGLVRPSVRRLLQVPWYRCRPSPIIATTYNSAIHQT